MKEKTSSLLKPKIRLFLLFCFLCSCHLTTFGQFYNGSIQKFGKNRIQYNNFFYSYYRFQNYEVYFYEGGDHLAKYATIKVDEYLDRYKTTLGLTTKFRMKFIVYRKLVEMRENNFGIDNEYSEVSATSNYAGNKIFLHFNGDHSNFDEQIKAGVLRALINQRIYSENWKSNFIGSTSHEKFPEYHVDGILSNFNTNYTINTEKFDQLVVKKKKFNINTLNYQERTVFGHLLWKYIINKYGLKNLGQIIYISGITESLNSGLFYTTGKEFDILSKEFLADYKSKLNPQEILQKKKADETNPVLIKTRRKKKYKNFIQSFDKKYFAYYVFNKGQYKIYVHNSSSRKPKKIYKKEHKLNRINDETFPIMSFHPKTNRLSFITEEKGLLIISHYDISTEQLFSKQLYKLDKVLSMSYQQNGRKILLSGVKNGKTDLYLYSPSGNSHKKITNDYFDDLNPRFLGNSNEISFTSNRTYKDSLKIEKKIKDTFSFKSNKNLFILNNDNKFVSQVTDENFKLNVLKANKYKDKVIFFAGKNLSKPDLIYSGTKDSAISHIDTIIHYDRFYNVSPVKELNARLLDSKFTNEENSITSIYSPIKRKKQRLTIEEIDDIPIKKSNIVLNEKKKKNLEEAKSTISLPDNYKKLKEYFIEKNIFDSLSYVNPYNYTFEIEKLKNKKLIKKPSRKKKDSTKFHFPNKRNYNLAFFKYKAEVKVSSAFLNQEYQVFNGGPFTSPGLSFHTTLATSELFENYKGYFGFQLGNKNEYFVKIENNKMLVDREYFYSFSRYQQTLNATLNKYTTQRIFYKLSYPFSEVSSFSAQFGIRYDKITTLGRNREELITPDDHKFENIIKLNFIFDNSQKIGLNIHEGIRMKLFSEYYQDIANKDGNFYMLNFGIDFRHYLRVYKKIILASRFAASTSLGSKKVIYYLGGVDNQINIPPVSENTFDKSTNINNQFNYRYQAIAPNIRGFGQNIRNGHSFGLFNTELRIPITHLLTRKFITSEFLNSLQILGFVDLGMAWDGLNPYDEINVLSKNTFTDGDFALSLEEKRSPLVGGFGFGVRMSLFGYFIRFDSGFGVQNNIINKKLKTYLSLEYDF